MNIKRTEKFKKQFKKLPSPIQKQVDKQIIFLTKDYRHPSLKSRKMGGSSIFEARISKGYRMRYLIDNQSIIMLTVGPHDEGLGKK